MNLCLFSPNFHPLVGGLENVVMDLASEFAEQGHEVNLITLTPNPKEDQFSFGVYRNPSFFQALKIHQKADVVMHFNVSLKGWPYWIFSGKPLLISHQSEYLNNWNGKVKYWLANHFAKNVGCSQYVARRFKNGIAIPNPYNHQVFKTITPWELRTKDLVFLGRLVSDKGADLLLEALYLLSKEGLEPQLSIIGKGPEEQKLQHLCQKWGLEDRVSFLGLKKGEDLVRQLNQHKCLVVPSIWQEPFGIVALEGMACGCVVIGSKGGGLGEAIGKAGVTFPNGDVNALMEAIKRVLLEPSYYHKVQEESVPHLFAHTKKVVAFEYLNELQKLKSNEKTDH